MTAHTSVRNYGAAAAAVCVPCGLDQSYDRYRDALTAAATHNREAHADEHTQTGVMEGLA